MSQHYLDHKTRAWSQNLNIIPTVQIQMTVLGLIPHQMAEVINQVVVVAVPPWPNMIHTNLLNLKLLPKELLPKVLLPKVLAEGSQIRLTTIQHTILAKPM